MFAIDDQWNDTFSQAVTKFFLVYSHPLDAELFKRVLAQIISSSKSNNALTRSNSIELFKALISHSNDDDPLNLASLAVSELLALPKTGKTGGPDHRVALYSMLTFLSSGTGVSSSLVESTIPLLAKETHEAATAVLAAALPPHVVFLLSSSTLSPDVIQLIAKEMSSAKPAVRKAFSGLAGAIFFHEADIISKENGVAFAKTVVPSFESSLKTVSGNPLNSPGGPFEGYVALAVLLGPLSRSGKFGSFHDPQWLRRRVADTVL